MWHENITDIRDNEDDSGKFNTMKILQVVIASSGVFTNITVVVIFANDRTMRKKIPNICIINQVCILFVYYVFYIFKTKNNEFTSKKLFLETHIEDAWYFSVI